MQQLPNKVEAVFIFGLIHCVTFFNRVDSFSSDDIAVDLTGVKTV
jgi:hypothetical protein